MKKNYCLFIIMLYGLNVYSQTVPLRSVTITPGAANIQDVQGNIKATGVVEGSTLKAAGLATGSYQVVSPIYANAEGLLITGYKLGYFSIPPAAFRRSIDIYIDEGTPSYLGNDLLLDTGGSLLFAAPSSGREMLAPVQIPHKSKLSSLKIIFSSSGSRYLEGSIIKASVNDFAAETSIFTFTTPATANSPVMAEFSIPLIEIDNQNYVYTLQLKSSTNDWNFLGIRGVSIEYRDF